jgi:hypothetical protein
MPSFVRAAANRASDSMRLRHERALAGGFFASLSEHRYWEYSLCTEQV